MLEINELNSLLLLFYFYYYYYYYYSSIEGPGLGFYSLLTSDMHLPLCESAVDAWFRRRILTL